jgi:hypothetical protein
VTLTVLRPVTPLAIDGKSKREEGREKIGPGKITDKSHPPNESAKDYSKFEVEIDFSGAKTIGCGDFSWKEAKKTPTYYI